MNRHYVWVILLALTFILTSCKPNNEEDINQAVTDPSIPNSPSPSNGATDRDSYQQLAWECSGASTYTVYFDKVNPPLSIAKTNSIEKYADVIAYGNGEVFYWRVVAKFTDGSKTISPVWRFTTSQVGSDQTGHILYTHSVTTEMPNIVNMLFQVTDVENNGIDNLTVNDFEIFEDGESISIFESNISITNQNNPYVIKTVLMLDNSTSITDDTEHPDNLALLKDAAKSFIDNMATQQEVSLYKFSSEPEMLLDFTSDKNALKAAIDNIGRGFPSTDLYGATIEGVSQWDDFISAEMIEQGSLVLFTDGNDTQGSNSLEHALDAIKEKKVYTVGLGSEIEPAILKQIGNQGAFLISDMSELNQLFIQIQEEIKTYANSYYWMEYASPKRGNNNHLIHLAVKNNSIYSVTEGEFSSAGFYDPIDGIYLNSSFSIPQGDSVFVLIAGGDPVEIKAITYGGDNTPFYVWEANASLTITEVENSYVKIYANSNAPAGMVTTKVDDTANGYSKSIQFNISR